MKIGFSQSIPDTPLTEFIDYFMHAFFVTDLFLNFITAIELQGQVYDNPRFIAKEYCKMWFWLDLMASIPIGIIMKLSETESEDSSGLSDLNKLSRLLKQARLAKMVRVLKLTRVAKLFKGGRFAGVMEFMESCLNVNPSLIQILKLMCLLVMIWHCK